MDAGTWERVPIPSRHYKTIEIRYDSDGLADWQEPSTMVAGAICRVRVKRPENVRPDYDLIRGLLEQAGCFDFRGFVEEVERTAAVRSKEIVEAQSLPELLRVWHEAKGSDVPIEDLTTAAVNLERTVLK
jgi:hypothetical protein